MGIATAVLSWLMTLLALAAVCLVTVFGWIAHGAKTVVDRSNLKEHADRLKLRAEEMRRKRDWSPGKVVFLVIAGILMLIIIPPLGVMAMVLFAGYGLIVFANKVLLDGKDPDPIAGAHRAKATDNQAPKQVVVVQTPIYRHMEPPPPARPAPAANRAEAHYPERSTGWFGSMFQGATVLILLIGISAAILVSSSRSVDRGRIVYFNNMPSQREAEEQKMRRNRHPQPPKPPKNPGHPMTVMAIEKGEKNVASAAVNASDSEGVQMLHLEVKECASEDHALEQLRVKLWMEMKACLEEKKNLMELDESWTPSQRWMRKITQKADVFPSKGPNGIEGEWYGAAITVPVNDDLINEVWKLYLDSQEQVRTLALAKAYGGAVLLLGGLAIFLRLGTGRRPKAPAVQ